MIGDKYGKGKNDYKLIYLIYFLKSFLAFQNNFFILIFNIRKFSF